MSIHVLLGKVNAWLHAGEEDGIIFYHQRFAGRLVYQACVLAALLLVFPFYRRIPHTVLIGLSVAVVLRTLSERRRAIIFTDKEIVYRPAFGGPRRVQFEKLMNIRRKAIAESYLLRPNVVPAIELHFNNGEILDLPLDFRERREILQRLSAATGKQIEGKWGKLIELRDTTN